MGSRPSFLVNCISLLLYILSRRKHNGHAKVAQPVCHASECDAIIEVFAVLGSQPLSLNCCSAARSEKVGGLFRLQDDPDKRSPSCVGHVII